MAWSRINEEEYFERLYQKVETRNNGLAEEILNRLKTCRGYANCACGDSSPGGLVSAFSDLVIFLGDENRDISKDFLKGIVDYYGNFADKDALEVLASVD